MIGLLLAAVGADDEQHPVIALDAAEQQDHREGHGAADAGHDIIAHAAADADNDGPKNINRIARVLDGGAEADDGQRAHHTERQRDVVADDGHDRPRQHRENDEPEALNLRL